MINLKKVIKMPLVMNLYFVLEFLILIGIKVSEYGFDKKALNVIQYSAIILNTIAAIVIFVSYKDKVRCTQANLIFAGLITTFFADFFLTLLEKPQILGFALFCVVELIYAAYLKPGKINVVLRTVLYAALLVLLGFANLLNFSNAVGILNISLVLVNVICAWISLRKRKNRSDIIFSIAITLFFLCDFSIVIRTLTSGTVHNIIAFMVWVFYVPSQVLMVTAYLRKIKEVTEQK